MPTDYLVGAGDAQYIFGGEVPAHGYCVQNNSNKPLWVSDGSEAEPTSGILLKPSDMFETQRDYVIRGKVTVFGWERGQEFEARSW